MEGVSIIGFLDGGLMAGLLARRQYDARRGFGHFGNLIVGMAGGFLGGFFLNALGIVSGSFVGAFVTGTVAGGMLLFIAGLIKVYGRGEGTTGISNRAADKTGETTAEPKGSGNSKRIRDWKKLLG